MSGKTDWTRWNWFVGIAGIFAVGFYVVWISDILADDPMEESSEPAVEEKADKVASDNVETKTEPVAAKPAAVAPVNKYESLSQDDAIKLAVKDAMYNDNYISHYIEDNTLWLTVKMDDGWSSNTMRKGGLMDSLAIAELVTEHTILGDLGEIYITFKSDLTDAYGNSEVGTVLEVLFTAETLSKINYDNVLSENVPKIADYYWEHPSFNK